MKNTLNGGLAGVLTGLMLVTAVLASPEAWADRERHGGEACRQSLNEVSDALIAELDRQVKLIDPYKSVDWNSFHWFFKRAKLEVVPQTSVDGIETDAATNRPLRKIEFSENRFCKANDLRKQAIMFHELLVLAEMEESNDYSISGNYINNIQLANQAKQSMDNTKKWVCNSMAYHTLGFADYANGMARGTPFEHDNWKPYLTEPYFGTAPEEAFDKMVKGQKHKMAFCKRVREIKRLDNSTGGTVYYSCEEFATFANACVMRF